MLQSQVYISKQNCSDMTKAVSKLKHVIHWLINQDIDLEALLKECKELQRMLKETATKARSIKTQVKKILRLLRKEERAVRKTVQEFERFENAIGREYENVKLSERDQKHLAKLHEYMKQEDILGKQIMKKAAKGGSLDQQILQFQKNHLSNEQMKGTISNLKSAITTIIAMIQIARKIRDLYKAVKS